MSQNPASLEADYRSREIVCQPVSLPFVVRMDGVNFSKSLDDVPGPRNELVYNALAISALEIARQYGASLIYVVSDEVNIAFTNHLPFGGRTFKIISVLSAVLSSRVSLRLSRPLAFDGRAVQLRDECDLARYVVYRARIGFNNFVSQYLRERGLIGAETPKLEDMVKMADLYPNWLATGIISSAKFKWTIEKNICKILNELCNIC